MGRRSKLVDLSSAGYLGLQHASEELRPWAQLSLGVPAALEAPPGASALGQKLALVQGCRRAILGSSTLHLLWDLFGMLAKTGVAIYLDSGAYPIVRWGCERAAGLGVRVRTFAHHDPDALRWQLDQDGRHLLQPLVVADGLCSSCGTPSPVAAYLEHARAFGGQVILDDTQALGILGHSPGLNEPYGRGGGGSLRWSNVEGPDVLMVSSLAKGFGVPLAVLAGSSDMVGWFEANSETLAHCSPPSVAIIHAGEHALSMNESGGDALRRRLAELVRHFRSRLRLAGFSASGGLFPVQTLAPLRGIDATTLHGRLLRLGVRTVLQGSHLGHGLHVSFLITALHDPADIDAAVDALTQAAGMKAIA